MFITDTSHLTLVCSQWLRVLGWKDTVSPLYSILHPVHQGDNRRQAKITDFKSESQRIT